VASRAALVAAIIHFFIVCCLYWVHEG